ncbi:FHA domain-containing protein [Nocardioides sp. S-58]|uniref:FHA domain-containing protein n=1 Tax=Nocardioides renjunii TaxID=3095075 RepID=A0ABU5KDD9_9ACTN|nr:MULTISPECIES: FHA domain-containing protein [unclassified Nocardioides]MDZ5662971.1 FHA domain-containing protein [Nocardioides sp. S-58]WQQ23152.1 FHA domain-containing protein [Nocardioides sp. S-34]
MLLGSGAHWVLLTDPGDEQVVQEIWDVLAMTAPSGSSVVERVMAIVEKSFAGDPPGLALVDFTSGASTALSRGAGHVRLAGPSRILSLDGGDDPDRLVPTRRLVGGVVAADRVELAPISTRTAPPAQPTAQATAPAAPGGALIDGIPAAILAAKGPDGPPPRTRTRRPVEDTGSLMDTSEPDPLAIQRIEEGSHTTIRPASAPHRAPEPGPAPDDHDGSTSMRPAHLSHSTAPTVLAVSCPLGHLTPPVSPQCRVCHQRVAPQEPRRVERPSLGGLRLPTGEVVPLDRGVILGRKPAPAEGSTDWPHLVHLPADHSFVSRRHLQIELDGWDVVARDLDSRGGTTVAPPGRDPQRMRPGDAYVLEPGTVLDMAHVYAVRFETGAVAR